MNPHFLFNSLNTIYSLSRHQSQETPDLVMQLSELMRYQLESSKKDTVLLKEELQIKHDGMPVNITFKSILYIQSFGNYLKIFTDSRMYLISETLINITTLLSENFQRTHKSYISNLDRVAKATRTHLLIENSKVPVSAMYKVIVFKKLEDLAKL